MIAIALVQAIFPIVWLALNSLKNRLEMFSRAAASGSPAVTNENYVATFIDRPFVTYMLNSLIVAVLSTFLSMLIGGPAGYALPASISARRNQHLVLDSVDPHDAADRDRDPDLHRSSPIWACSIPRPRW